MTEIFYKNKSKYSTAYISNHIYIAIHDRQPKIYVQEPITRISSYAPLTRLQAAQILKAWHKQLTRKSLLPKG